ncbi:MAG: hypothetical protein HOW73_24030 [Polyangiaceae bacterium]|nr:hypothetical protein [Polyangiaceae bacterium]
MTAAKWGDPVLGIDVHLVVIPSPPGTAPLPHPFVGAVFDPIGAAVGAAVSAVLGGGGPVFVNGLPTGNTGTEAMNVPHFPTPPGTAPAPGDAPPDNEGTLLTGSKTVKFAGSSQSRELSQAISCSFPIDLPTSVVTPVPVGAPVNIGGPEAIDFMVAAAAAVKAGLKFAKRKWGKQISDWAHKKFKLASGGKRSKVICFLTGHPVDVASGELLADAVDFELGGAVMPLKWERNYRSREGRHPTMPTLATTMTARTPALGSAWFHPFESWIEEEAQGAIVHLRGADGRPKTFYSLMRPGDSVWEPEDRETLVRTPQGYEVVFVDGRRWIYRLVEGSSPRGAERRVLLPIAVVDPSHNRIELHYERGYLRYVIDAAGRVLDVRWNAQHRIESIWFAGLVPARTGEPAGSLPDPTRGMTVLEKPHRLVAYRYEDGQLTQAIDAADHAMRYAWSGGVITEEVHKGGLTFRFAWDMDHPDGNCIRTWGENPSFDSSPGATNAMPRVIYDRRIQYQKERRLTVVEDGRGGVTRYFTNALGLVDKVVDPVGVVTEYEYRPETWKVLERDGLGNETKWDHDERGRVIRETNALGEETTWQYDAFGNVVELVNPAKGRTTLAWDHRRKPVAITNPTGDVTRYSHDDRGRLKAFQDPMGRSTDLTWTERHDVATVVDAERRITQLAHDTFGRLSYSKDPLGRELRVTRNLVGEPVQIDRPDGERLTLTRDEEGNVVEQTDALSRRVRMRYAGLGRLIEHTDAMGWRVQLRYDSDEELVAIANQTGDEYAFELNLAGRVKSERTFSGTKRQYAYDKAGRTKQFFTGGHRVVAFERDKLGRIVAQRTTSPVLGGAPTEETYSYDEVGDLVGAATKGGAVNLSRDANGRITKESTRIDFTATEASVRSTYDRSGLRLERTTSLAHRASYRYNNAGDITGVSVGWELGENLPILRRLGVPQASAPDFEIAFARNGLGEELARRLPGGVAVRWGRDQFGRPIEQRVVTGASGTTEGSDVLRRGYNWSAPDQISGIFDLSAEGHARGGSRYEHDPRGYLIRQLFSDGTELHRSADAAGNLFRTRDMSDRVYGKGGVLNRIGATQLEHDADGNLVKKTLSDGAVWKYDWDAKGQLVTVHRPDGKEVAFTYDAFGRRLTKSFAGAITEYFWDGDDLVHERIRDADGSLEPSLTTWVFDPGRFAPLAKVEGRKRYGVVTDHLGTPNLLTTEAGQIAWKAQLDIYGVVREEGAGIEAEARTSNPWRFPGQYEDAETGLYYNRFRYYDPELGRYLSEDPIGLAGGAALYGYVHEPHLWVDPAGLSGCRGPLPTVVEGQPNRGWLHIFMRHVPGYGTDQGDLFRFASGTSEAKMREALTKGMNEVWGKGARNTAPGATMQVFEKRLKVGEQSARHVLVVDTARNEVITFFPRLST